jgi:hypothetical protein
MQNIPERKWYFLCFIRLGEIPSMLGNKSEAKGKLTVAHIASEKNRLLLFWGEMIKLVAIKPFTC